MAFVKNTLSNLPVTSGNVFFVDAGASRAADGNRGQDPAVPLATIDAAIARCTANNGDMIVVMPGHTESPTAAITMDVAGVWVYGLGWGNDRPTVTSSNATNFVLMSAASCRISNIVFVLGVATSTACVNVTAAGCIVEEIETKIHATSQFTNHIMVGAVEDVIIRNNRLLSLITASSNSGIYLDGCDQLQVYGNEIMGHFDIAAIDNVTGTDEALLAVVKRNLVRNISDSGMAIDMDDAATGLLADNLWAVSVDFEVGFDPGDLFCLENYLVDLVNITGKIIPTAAAAS